MATLAIQDIHGFMEDVPLVVDLDGTLIRSDLLVESGFTYLGRNPGGVGRLIQAMQRGKATLKEHIAAVTPIDAAHLPYDERVIALIRGARASGRPVYLASASNERYVNAVAAHLGLFDGWYGSSAMENLSATAKAERLVEAHGERRFDYIGNDAADLAVWSKARRRIAVHPSEAVLRQLRAMDPAAEVIEPEGGRWRQWIKLLRVHQWAKNLLVFIPLLTSHHFGWGSIAASVAAFLAFSLAASGVYIINDLVDIEADRRHPTKKRRPLAAGTVPILAAAPVALLLTISAMAIAFATAPQLAGILLLYLVLTTAYSVILKRKMLVDVVVLTLLYTIRVIGGAVAISVLVSQWLLAFSMFIFAALALIKRYVDLVVRLDGQLPDPDNRNYRKDDLDVIAALAAAAGFNAVTVFALYIASDTVQSLYRMPEILWLVCPILMYWIARALLMAHRRLMHDDPIIFALRDRNSQLALSLIGLLFLAAL